MARVTSGRTMDLAEKSGDGDVVLAWRWFEPLPFLIYASAAVLMVCGLIAWRRDPSANLSIWEPALWTAGIVATGYRALTNAVNRTQVTIARDRIELRHGPLPAGRTVRLAPDQICRVFLRHENPQAEVVRDSGYFALMVDVRDGRTLCLVECSSRVDAEFVLSRIQADAGLSSSDLLRRWEQRRRV